MTVDSLITVAIKSLVNLLQRYLSTSSATVSAYSFSDLSSS
jgi:hypothetical protein